MYDFNRFVYISIYSFGRQFYTNRFYYKWSQPVRGFEPLNCWVSLVDCIRTVNVIEGSVSSTIICPAKNLFIYLFTYVHEYKEATVSTALKLFIAYKWFIIAKKIGWFLA